VQQRWTALLALGMMTIAWAGREPGRNVGRRIGRR